MSLPMSCRWFLPIYLEVILLLYFQLGFTSYKAENPLRGMEWEEIEEKD